METMSAAAPARSVAISSVGLQVNLELLLRSGPDAHSGLTGAELVAEKVALLAAMSGNYPQSWWPECNACGCYNDADEQSKATAAAAAAYVAAHMPPSVPVVFLGYDEANDSSSRRAYSCSATGTGTVYSYRCSVQL